MRTSLESPPARLRPPFPQWLPRSDSERTLSPEAPIPAFARGPVAVDRASLLHPVRPVATRTVPAGNRPGDPTHHRPS